MFLYVSHGFEMILQVMSAYAEPTHLIFAAVKDNDNTGRGLISTAPYKHHLENIGDFDGAPISTVSKTCNSMYLF